jgi:Holliday junction resolvase RusA-like endonuclease
MVTVQIPGPPMWKERPRWDPRTGRVYTPKTTKDAEDIVKTFVRARCRQPLDGLLRVSIAVRVGELGSARPDIDNFAKLVLDACNKTAWRDDRQVVELHVFLERDSATPGTDIVIERVEEAHD